MTIIQPHNRQELREWLMTHAATETEVWVLCSRSKDSLWLDGYEIVRYLDVVEEALCFGWIDSTVRKNPNGQGCLQRLSPRRKNSHWTDLNIERCQQLIELGVMTDSGKQVMPKIIH